MLNPIDDLFSMFCKTRSSLCFRICSDFWYALCWCCWRRWFRGFGWGCGGRLAVVFRGFVVGRADTGHPCWTLVVLLSRIDIDVLRVESRLVLALGWYLDLEFCLLGRLEVVREVGGLVQPLEGPAGIGLLEELLMMARSALWMREGVGGYTLGSTSRASAGCSHGHSCGEYLLAYFAG